MIDPKLNELPEKSKAGSRNVSSTGLEEPEKTSSAEKPRAGLSVNDTVAANANLSVGGRGADTSGVRAGSGAGAGGTHLSAASSNRSPVPNVEPGPGGVGTTPLSTSASNLRSESSTVSSRRNRRACVSLLARARLPRGFARRGLASSRTRAPRAKSRKSRSQQPSK